MANGKHLTALAVKMGMRYYEEQNLVFGKVAGYECAVREQPEKKMMMVHVVAKSAVDDSGMQQLLEQLRAVDGVNDQIAEVEAELVRRNGGQVCPRCGGASAGGDRFCRHCGAKL